MNTRLGQRLRKLRHDKGVTQEEVAGAIGVTYQAVSKWENDTTMPDITLLPALAMYFGVSIDALFSVDMTDEVRRVDTILQQGMVSEEQFSYVSRVLEAAIREYGRTPDLIKRTLRLLLS